MLIARHCIAKILFPICVGLNPTIILSLSVGSGIGGLALAWRSLPLTLRCALSSTLASGIPASYCIKPRKMPPRPLGLNAGVAHAECNVCCLRGIVSRMKVLILSISRGCHPRPLSISVQIRFGHFSQKNPLLFAYLEKKLYLCSRKGFDA